MTAYIRGTTINGLVNAVLLSYALIGLGIPLVLPIALLTFVGGYLPVIGAIVSGAFAAIVALVVKGPITALIVIGVTIVIHNLEGYIVGPKVLGHQVNLHPVVIILASWAGTAIAGIPGAFLAVLTTSMLIVVYNHFHHPSQVEPLEDEGGLPEAEAERDGSAPADIVTTGSTKGSQSTSTSMTPSPSRRRVAGQAASDSTRAFAGAVARVAHHSWPAFTGSRTAMGQQP